MPDDLLSPAGLEAAQRRTVRSLVVTQALGGVGLTAAVAMAALLARDISGSEGLAGLAQTSQVLGAAVGAAALAALMTRRGRRLGLTLGYLLGACGAVLCVTAGVLRSFPLLLVGAALLGCVTASNQQTRYAATDLADPARRGRDLSTVVWATTIGSVVGPNLSGPGAAVAAALHLPEKTGVFVIGAGTLVGTAAVMAVRLRPDPLLLARAALLQDQQRQPDHGSVGPPVPVSLRSTWAVIRRTPLVVVAALGLALTQAVMVSVMVMTPIHMDHGGASLQVIGLVISVHVLGMFAFSPVVGRLVDRVGSAPVLGAGGLVLLGSLVFAGLSSPGASLGLGVGLFLLGLGWSFGTIAASTLLTSAAPVEHRPQIQGVVDMTTGLTAAAGGAAAGLVVGTVGYGWLSAGAAVLAFGVVLAATAAGRLGLQTDEHLAGVGALQE